jgi:hypothetical protein
MKNGARRAGVTEDAAKELCFKGAPKFRSSESLTQSKAPRCRRATRFFNSASATYIPATSIQKHSPPSNLARNFEKRHARGVGVNKDAAKALCVKGALEF